MNYESLIDVIANTTLREDNLKYEHTELDKEILKRKISMHIDNCIRNGRLIHFLKKDVDVIEVPQVIRNENPALYGKIYATRELDGFRLFLATPGYLRACSKFYQSESSSKYALMLGYDQPYASPKKIFDAELTQEYIDYMTFFTICADHTLYADIHSAAHFFNMQPQVYGENRNLAGTFHQDIFHITDDKADEWDSILSLAPNKSEERHIEEQLEAIGDCRECYIFRKVYSKICRGYFKQVFDFKDVHGFAIMKVIKQIDCAPAGAFKNYVPVTNWMIKSRPASKLLTVPMPGKQILYNLDVIVRSDTVVICPNLEIADQLQRENKLPKLAYTSFLCDEGCVNQVDFSPLHGKQVVLLTVNHSSHTLFEVLHANLNLYKYLRNNEKFEEEQLSVLVAEVKYLATQKSFDSLADYLDYYDSHAKPVTYKESIKLLSSYQELEEEYNKAAEHVRKLEELNRPYWYQAVAEQDGAESAPVDSCSGKQLMRGVVARGAITFICGQKHIGKTNFTSSLIARLLNTSQRAPEFLKERCWTPCKCVKTTPLKIAYLDYENGKEKFEHDVKPNFIVPYLSGKDQETNLIYKDMSQEAEYDYSQKAYFEKFCKFLDDIASKDGTPGKAIDVLVIDTYWSFVDSNDHNYSVFGKLQKRYPEMAIIVQHHLNEKGSFYGRQDKIFKVAVVIDLTRESSKSCNLETAFQVTIKNSRLTSFEKDLETFNAHYDKESKRFVVDSGHDQDEDYNCSYEEYIKALGNHYKTIGRTKDDLAEDLGVSPTSLASLLKK